MNYEADLEKVLSSLEKDITLIKSIIKFDENAEEVIDLSALEELRENLAQLSA